MKNLFIDTNVYLSFYDFYDEDIEELNKLVAAISEGEIRLYITNQVINEIKRNRESRLNDAYKKFTDSKPVIQMPIMCKHYDEYEIIKRIQRLLANAKDQLKSKLDEDIKNNSLKADVLLTALHSVAVRIETENYIDLAKNRNFLGNPPGKNKTIGDEINWEGLLAEVENDGELILISHDGDFKNDFDGVQIKPFLRDEWLEKKKTEIYLYKSLGRFFEEHDIAIELRSEEERNEFIQQLNDSSTFMSTHRSISKLSSFSYFSDDQVKQMARALLENDQVYSIATDYDVNHFYKRILLSKIDLFSEDEWSTMMSRLGREDATSLVISEIERKLSGEDYDPESIPF
jgi:predicted nucleic acid-binding protein